MLDCFLALPQPTTQLFRLVADPPAVALEALSSLDIALLATWAPVLEADSRPATGRRVRLVVVTRAQAAAAVHVDEPVCARRPRPARLARRAGDLLDAHNGLDERVAVPSHHVVFYRNVVELLLEAGVESPFAVGCIGHTRVERGGSARPG